MLCMETVIKVLRLHFKDKLSQRAIAERLGISRTTVRKYLKQELTQAPSFTCTRIHYPKLGNFIPLLTERLNHEIQLPERQRYTARRHFEWLQDQGLKVSIVQFQLLFANSTNNINHHRHPHSSIKGLYLQRLISLIGALKLYKLTVSPSK